MSQAETYEKLRDLTRQLVEAAKLRQYNAERLERALWNHPPPHTTWSPEKRKALADMARNGLSEWATLEQEAAEELDRLHRSVSYNAPK